MQWLVRKAFGSTVLGPNSTKKEMFDLIDASGLGSSKPDQKHPGALRHGRIVPGINKERNTRKPEKKILNRQSWTHGSNYF
jgi:hypothetical protein